MGALGCEFEIMTQYRESAEPASSAGSAPPTEPSVSDWLALRGRPRTSPWVPPNHGGGWRRLPGPVADARGSVGVGRGALWGLDGK